MGKEKIVLLDRKPKRAEACSLAKKKNQQSSFAHKMLNYTGQKLNSKTQTAGNLVGTAKILTVDSFMTSFSSDVRICRKFLLWLIARVLIYAVCIFKPVINIFSLSCISKILEEFLSHIMKHTTMSGHY